MRISRLLALGLAGLLGLAVASPAQAELLPFSATFSIEFPTSPAFPTVLTSGSGTLSATVTAGGGLLGFTLPSGVLSATVTSAVSPAIPLLPPHITLTSLQVMASNGGGSFAALGGGTGTMPVQGMAVLLLHAYSGTQAAALSLTGAMGVSGTVQIVISGLVPISLIGNPWTTGTIGFGGSPTPSIFVNGSHQSSTCYTSAAGAVAGTGATTPCAAGAFRANRWNYVTPTLIVIPGVPTIEVLGRLVVDTAAQVPEPGILVLLASGLALVGVATLRR